MSALISTLVTAGVGAGSAFIPILNAEAYALAAVARSPLLIVPIVLALTVGQTVGKTVMFEAARRGAGKLDDSPRMQALVSSRWGERIQSALRQPRTALPMVLTSAGLGLPPLALVSVAAGAAGQPRRGFILMCFTGRALRFTALAAPVALAVAHS